MPPRSTEVGRSPRIVVIGGSFTNKGAEAMVLTTVEQLTRRFPDARITVASYVKREAIGYGPHTDVQGTRGSFEYIRNGRQLGKPLQVFLMGLPLPGALRSAVLQGDAYLSRLADADVVLDVSGFAMSDQRELLRRLVYCFDIAACRWVGVPFVALTQAFGPFSGVTRALAATFLPMARLIIARGSDTGRHLRSAGINGFQTCCDMAYLFRGYGPEVGRKILAGLGLPESARTFGIVPNINLYRRSEGHERDNAYVRGLARLTQLAEQLGATPVFVCHEDYADRQSDEWLARQVIATAGVASALVVPASHSAAELKAVLRSLDFVVACRFHAVVGALSTATPFLALGWSHKYEELVLEAGEQTAVLDGRFTDPAMWCSRARELWDDREAMRARLAGKVDDLKASAASAFDAVGHLLDAGTEAPSEEAEEAAPPSGLRAVN